MTRARRLRSAGLFPQRPNRLLQGCGGLDLHDHPQAARPRPSSLLAGLQFGDGGGVEPLALARRAGFVLHTAMTCGGVAQVRSMFHEITPAMERAALLAVLQTLREAICQGCGKTERIHFDVADWKLWACVGPGDNGKPVLTIMMQGED